MTSYSSYWVQCPYCHFHKQLIEGSSFYTNKKGERDCHEEFCTECKKDISRMAIFTIKEYRRFFTILGNIDDVIWEKKRVSKKNKITWINNLINLFNGSMIYRNPEKELDIFMKSRREKEKDKK